jgi:hypothetical protein
MALSLVFLEVQIPGSGRRERGHGRMDETGYASLRGAPFAELRRGPVRSISGRGGGLSSNWRRKNAEILFSVARSHRAATPAHLAHPVMGLPDFLESASGANV